MSSAAHEAVGGAERSSNAARRPKTRVNDPAATKEDILEVATAEFAANGYTGARVDEIAARTKTSKRMIYYYFGSKNGLYRAVLEESYRKIRKVESRLSLGELPPLEALAELVRFRFDYQNQHPDFVRLVMAENIHNAEHLRQSPTISQMMTPAIGSLAAIYERGRSSGVMREDIDLIDLHMTISALSFFNVSNRHTFSTIFNRDMTSPEALARRREVVVDTVIRYVRP